MQELAKQIAGEFGISYKQFSNLLDSESKWNPDAYNAKTQDRGIAQISRIWHPEVTDECAFDAECSMRWTAQRLLDGYSYEWSVCNCYAQAKAIKGKLPKMENLKPNGPISVGSLAIFNYKGVKHVGVVSTINSVSFTIREANFVPCRASSRTISFTDKALVGFYSP